MERLSGALSAGPDAREEMAADLVRAMRLLEARGLVYGSIGNGSIRDGRRVWITPSRMPYADMGAEEVVEVGLDGADATGASEPARPPSRELPLHLAVYRARPDVRAILHTHSTYALAWSFLPDALPQAIEDLGYYGTGPVRTIPYAPPGSAALADGAAAALRDARAVLLGRHGVLAAAGSLPDALGIAQAVERQAHVAWLLRGERAARAARSTARHPTPTIRPCPGLRPTPS
jgi:L-fuculose-phosphate aldolase